MPKRILVIGATGLLGGPVAHGLLARGFDVRVMSRGAEGARARFPEPFEIAAGDALEVADVARALDGCDAAHVSIDHEREDECVAQVLEAAGPGGLERINYISGVTVCEENRWFPLVDRKLRSEEAIRASGIGFSIFRPGYFMEMLARFIRDGRALVVGRPRRRWHFVALDDFARMVVESYGRPEAIGKSFYVHGPESLTVLQAVQAYCRALHPEIRSFRGTPVWLLHLIARLRGSAEMRRGVDMVAYLEAVGERGDPTEANAILGAPRITLDAWLEQHRRQAA